VHRLGKDFKVGIDVLSNFGLALGYDDGRDASNEIRDARFESRIADPETRISYPVSRIANPASRIPYHTSMKEG